MIIQYIPYGQIDKIKLDACIAVADNSLIYAYSFYLDAMTDQWDAIIINDYEEVMPLPWKKKWGIKYYYNPPFTPQLGLFKKGNSAISADILALIQRRVKYGDIFFNYKNTVALQTLQQTNYIIPLNQQYINIAAGYKLYLKNILKKSKKENFIYSEKENFDTTVALYQQYYFERTPHVTKIDYEHFLNLCKLLSIKKMAFTRGILDSNNEILSTSIFLLDEKRIYYIMNANTPKGKVKESNSILLDSVIKEFSGRELVFDFEGQILKG
ncbi:MAG: hypothetical protein IPJ81_01485 [Chitinophagaceae bacterium]|nr:hypothetical protein [Chitinophagaceae bacterium]